MDGVKKIAKLRFLTEGTGRTLGQAAIQFLLAQPNYASALPNIYDEPLLVEMAGASDTPPSRQTSWHRSPTCTRMVSIWNRKPRPFPHRDKRRLDALASTCTFTTNALQVVKVHEYR